MRRYLKKICVSLVLLLLISCTNTQGVNYVTVSDIKSGLPQETLIVGFDIDDTVLFSSPGFNYGLTNKDGLDNVNIYGEDPLNSPEFWSDMNGKFDNYSLPKKSGGELIKMHYERGDKIVFISARDVSGKSIIPRILSQSFKIPTPEVILTSGESKTKFILENGIYIYYGDADTDMSQAIDASARPIRVIRSSISTNPSPHEIGKYGEEVLRDSDK